MFEKFLSATSGDFKQRYEGTFGFFRKEDGTKMLSQLVNIGERTCDFTDSRGVSFQLNADSNNDKIGFEFIPPKSHFYNTPDGKVYLVQRVAARQFQRGISAKNTVIYMLEGRFVSMRVDFKNLDTVYNKALSPKQAVAQLEKGNPFALSGSFAVDGKSALYLYDSVAGSYTTDDRKHFKVKLSEPDLWRTEVTDAFRSLSKTVEVA